MSDGLAVRQVQVTLRQAQEMQGIQHICLPVPIVSRDDIHLRIEGPIRRAMVFKMCEL
jgi:hypothetical protein